MTDKQVSEIADTVERFMFAAILAVDRQFGMGTSGTKPEFVAAFMQTCATLHNGGMRDET
jgi:hypothetical protein